MKRNPAGGVHSSADGMHGFHERRSPRNFSKNLPETTGLNHQYTRRRAFIVRSSLTRTVAFARGLAETPAQACDLFHN
jgi:hypothetical protein